MKKEKVLRHGVKIQKVGEVFVVTTTIKIEGKGWQDNKNFKPIRTKKWDEAKSYVRDNYYRGEVSILNLVTEDDGVDNPFIYLERDPVKNL
jgi:hypothetical protein